MFSKFLKSAYAHKHGIINLPDEIRDVDNLFWLATAVEPDLTRAIQTFDPSIEEFSSAYRNDAVNHGVGGVDNSRHENGLALDYPTADSRTLLSWLRRHPELWPPRLKLAYAEIDHAHFEFYGPGEIASEPVWRWERTPGASVPL